VRQLWPALLRAYEPESLIGRNGSDRGGIWRPRKLRRLNHKRHDSRSLAEGGKPCWQLFEDVPIGNAAEVAAEFCSAWRRASAPVPHDRRPWGVFFSSTPAHARSATLRRRPRGCAGRANKPVSVAYLANRKRQRPDTAAVGHPAKRKKYDGKPEYPNLGERRFHPTANLRETNAADAQMLQWAQKSQSESLGRIGLELFFSRATHREKTQKTSFPAADGAWRKPRSCPSSFIAVPSDNTPDTPGNDLPIVNRRTLGGGGLGGILHCFNRTTEHARRRPRHGFHDSFAGNITSPRRSPPPRLRSMVPLDAC